MFGNNNNLLKIVSNQYKTDLSSVKLVACQHILGTTVDLLKMLATKGLKPSNTYIIGKCYSTNKSVFEKIKKMGIHIDESSQLYDSKQPFDKQFESYIDSFVKNSINNNQKEKVVVLDDGGQLISTFNNKYKGDFSDVSGVEQTSSGFEKISKINLKFPVINIARSKTKLEIESPIIANIVIKEIYHLFKRRRLKNPKILLIGGGYVGNSITNQLSKRYEVDLYDLLTHNAPFPGDYSSKLKEYDVIFGATGRSILKPSEYSLLKDNAVLISASSSDREFSVGEIRKELPRNPNCHNDLEYKNTVIVNGGFPVNFTGRKHSAPPAKIMLTRALLLAGVLEANKLNDKIGIVELPNSIQELIIDNFKT